tara:strand:- start:9444 stop:9575 length:132 start_codon:yes stop_codon:yes gene_type:complete
MVLADIPDEMTGDPLRFRDLVRRKELQPEIIGDGKDLFDRMDP